jgi:hypothetical protein
LQKQLTTMSKTRKPLPKNEPNQGNLPIFEEGFIDFDRIWKLAIVDFFLDFIAFFLPNLYKDLDMTVPPVYLDNELLTLHKELRIKKQITDKLIKVRLLDGTERTLLVHVEVQTGFEKDFSNRMYLYQAFIYARHRLPITALAIFKREDTPKHFNTYEYDSYGTKLHYEYNAYKMAEQDEETLVKSDNVFALFVLAHLYIIRTSPAKYEERSVLKAKLIELANERQIDKEKIDRMLIFVDELMILPDYLQKSLVLTMAAKHFKKDKSMDEFRMYLAKKEEIWRPIWMYRHFERDPIGFFEDLNQRLTRLTAREIAVDNRNAAADLRKEELDAKLAKTNELLKILQEEKKLASQERKQASEERKQASEERKQASEERKQASEEKKQASEEKKRILEEEKQVFEEKKRILEDEKQVSEEKKRILEEEKQVSEEKKRILEDKKRIKETLEKAQADNLLRLIQSILVLHPYTANVEKLATILQIELPIVEFVLHKHVQEKLSAQEIVPLLRQK